MMCLLHFAVLRKRKKEYISWPRLVRPFARRLISQPRSIASVFFLGAMDPDNFHLEITNLAVSSHGRIRPIPAERRNPRPSGDGARIPAF